MATAELETPDPELFDAFLEAGKEVEPVTLRATDPDLVSQLINANRKFKEQESTVDSLKADLKAAKEEMDGCARLISRLITQMEFDDDRPLFSLISPDGEQPKANEPGATEDPWRLVPIDELDDISDAARKSLAENGAGTLGALADMIASESWPKGFGPKKQEAIIASLNLWQENNAGQNEDTATVPVTDPEWDTKSEDEKSSWLNARAVELDSDDADALLCADDDLTDNGRAWAEGCEAQDSGDEIVNCPHPPGAACDAWIAGWLWQGKQA